MYGNGIAPDLVSLVSSLHGGWAGMNDSQTEQWIRNKWHQCWFVKPLLIGRVREFVKGCIRECAVSALETVLESVFKVCREGVKECTESVFRVS